MTEKRKRPLWAHLDNLSLRETALFNEAMAAVGHPHMQRAERDWKGCCRAQRVAIHYCYQYDAAL